LINFKSGAFLPGTPVLPICLKYKWEFHDPSWTADIGMLPTVLGLMCQFVNYLEIEILDPYIPNEQERKDPYLFANNLRIKMAKHLAVDMTDYSFEDVLLFNHAKKLRIPPTSVDLHMPISKVKESLNIDLDEAIKRLQAFANIDKDKDGRIDSKEFSQVLNLPSSDLTQELFHFLDIDETGSLKFQQYLVGVSMLQAEKTQDEFVKQCFFLYDKSGDGAVSREELRQIMKRVFQGTSEADMQSFMEQIDLNGRITYKQFAQVTQNNSTYTIVPSTLAQKIHLLREEI